MVTQLIGVLFALLFARALVAYLRGRDPLQRGVTAMFGSVAALFLLDWIGRILGSTPNVARDAVAVLLLAHPFLTLRVVARLRPVPRWLQIGTLVLYLGTALPLVVLPRPLPPAIVLAALGAFVGTEIVAAVLVLLEARRKSAAPRIRLAAAGAATLLMSLALAIIGAGTAAPAIRASTGPGGRFVALLAALGYLIAFVPPGWLRRLWSADTLYTATERLLRAPATAGGDATWQRYVETVRAAAGAHGAVVLLAHNGVVRVCAAENVTIDPRVQYGADELDALLAHRQPVSTRAKNACPLALTLGGGSGAQFVTAVPFAVPFSGYGALVLLDRYRSLFPEDDARLLGTLGVHAGILAEREAMLAAQQRLTEQLRESVTAVTAASQAKTDFLASMSHELRTPLNAIIGFSELMRGEPGSDERRSVPAEWIDHIYTSGRHLLGLVNEVLDLAKVEAGRLELHRESVDLSKLIDDAVTALHPLIESKDLSVTIDVEPLVIEVDPQRLRQVADNLLSNAIKFTPPGGRVSVTATARGVWVALTVADTGIGIDPADHERVFEEFQQVGDAKLHKAGTGLGLALTRRLVAAHGGSIELRSQPGQGSAFTVRLPFSGAVRARAERHVAAARGRVLLIEDEPCAAELLRTYLDEAGYEVRIADSGEAGLAAIADQAPDVVLLDVGLPGIDGFEVLRRLKSDERFRRIPVFVTSVVDERAAGLALGATDFLVKPIDRDALLGHLARHLLPEGTSRTALVIDADSSTVDALRTQLQRSGFEVVSCASAADGLRVARSRPVDLIICGLPLPDRDGMTALAALDADPATCAVPVLAWTTINGADWGTGRPILGVLARGGEVDRQLTDYLQSRALAHSDVAAGATTLLEQT